MDNIAQYLLGALGGSAVALLIAYQWLNKLIDNRLQEQTHVAVARITAQLTIEAQRDSVTFTSHHSRKFQSILELHQALSKLHGMVPGAKLMMNPYATRPSSKDAQNSFELGLKLLDISSGASSRIEEYSIFLDDELVEKMTSYRENFSKLFIPYMGQAAEENIHSRTTLANYWEGLRAELVPKMIVQYTEIKKTFKKELKNSK